MDTARAQQLTEVFRTHRQMVLVTLVCLTLAQLRSMGTIHALSGALLSMGYFLRTINFHRYYNGYGVAREVNAYLQHPLMRTPPLTLLRTTPVTLLHSWLRKSIFVTLLHILAFIGAYGGFAHVVVLNAMKFVSIVLFSALVAEMYIWIVAERKLHWYLHEMHLRKLLSAQSVPPKEIAHLTSELGNMGLLIRGVPPH